MTLFLYFKNYNNQINKIKNNVFLVLTQQSGP